MDLNLVVLAGRLASPIELRTFPNGNRLFRCLLTVISDRPRRRVDVIPVALWSPPDHLCEGPWAVGERVFVAGSIQRRFWSDNPERRSRLEVVAKQVVRRPGELQLDYEEDEPLKNSAASADPLATQAT